jgi:hypothetical protein
MKMNLPNEFQDDEGSTLSADASPFHPKYEPVEIAIFNDGVPSMMMPTEQDRYDILHGIEDQALDEEFPPDAGDAAELEAAEAFVIEMATLAMLEEREERARHGFYHFKKRWEVRRAAGPSGRPRPAMNLIVPVDHATKNATVHIKTLVPYSHHRGVAHERTLEIKMSQRIEPRQTKMTAMSNRQTIQQPRKHS